MHEQWETFEPESLPSVTIKVPTPDGTMYVCISDYEGRPWRVDITIGKAGSALMAWAHSLARLCTMALQGSASLDDLINELAGVTSDKLTMNQRTEVRSGPEGVAIAFLRYLEQK